MAQARSKNKPRLPAVKRKPKKDHPQRKLLNVDIRDIADVLDRIKEEAHARQYTHFTPFLRRVLVKLFREGEIKLLSL